MRRFPTGVPGLDRVLGGGLFRGRLYLVAGSPGTGKTVLANQSAFHLARRGGRTAYVTLLTESHGQMIENLSGLAFFDREVIGTSIRYVSAYQAAREGGLDGIYELIESSVRERDGGPAWADAVVLDGTAAIEETAISALEFRAFLNRLRALNEVTGCTAFVILPGRLAPHEPLFTMADGVLELANVRAGMRTARELSVSKLRGGVHLGGWHVFDIDERGITVHPRIEAVFARPTRMPSRTRRRTAFGVPRLDEMLGGGVPGESATAIVGDPGSGKTLLGSCLLAEGLRQGEPALHVGMYESPDRLRDHAESIGLPFDRYHREGLLHIIWVSPAALALDELVERTLDVVHRHGIRRLVLDGVDGLRHHAFHPARVPFVLAAVINELRALGVTNAITAEQPMLGVEPSPEQLSTLADNQILVRFVELRSQLYRFLSVTKLRGSGYDTSLREFHISSRGFEVADTFERAEEILTGVAKTRPASSSTRPRNERG